MLQHSVKYRIYPSLLDGYTNLKQSGEVWEMYWGFSENPPHTQEEFEQIQFQELIDKINRVPSEPSQAALRGTALNTLCDRLVCGITDPRCEFVPINAEDGEVMGFKALITDRDASGEFFFPRAMTDKLISLYPTLETIPQAQLSNVIVSPKYGAVELYGYADYILPHSIHDLKTTGKYAVGKFKHHAQHLVYPYCVDPQRVQRFDYDVVEITKGNAWAFYQETYIYEPQRDILRLIALLEEFIEWLESNREKITDKKIFNQEEQ